jgi:thiol-disulfide isomerase/thioredoxin
MSDYSSIMSFGDFAALKGGKLRGGADETNGAIIAVVVVIIVILLVAIILAACWSCGSKTETVYITNADGTQTAVKVAKGGKRLYSAGKGGKALKDLPPMNPHRAGGKTYELATSQEAQALLDHPAPAMLFVYMQNCGFCDKAKQYFNNQLAKQHPYVTLAMIDSAKCGDLCKKHGVTGFPTFLSNFHADSGTVTAHVGFKPKQVMDQMLSVAQSKAHAAPSRFSRMAQGGATNGVHELTDGATSAVTQAEQHLAGNDKVVLFVYAPWCGFCKRQKPVFDELAAKFGSGYKFLAVNADTAGKALAQKYGMNGFPAFMVNFGAGAAPGKPKVMTGYRDAAAFESQILRA